jgi:hypothetical protein
MIARGDVLIGTSIGSRWPQFSQAATTCITALTLATHISDLQPPGPWHSGTTRTTIVMPTTGEQSHLALSPDGSTIVLQATCGGDNAARSLWKVPAAPTTNYSCADGQRISASGTDATHASWGPNNMIVWASVTGGTNSTSPVLSDLLLWQDDMVRPLESGTGDIRNPSWSPVGTVIGDW